VQAGHYGQFWLDNLNGQDCGILLFFAVKLAACYLHGLHALICVHLPFPKMVIAKLHYDQFSAVCPHIGLLVGVMLGKAAHEFE